MLIFHNINTVSLSFNVNHQPMANSVEENNKSWQTPKSFYDSIDVLTSICDFIKAHPMS